MPGIADHYRPMIEFERERAIRELKALVEQAPRLVPAHALLMTAYHRCLDFENCAAAARALLALKPDHSDALHNLAFSLMMLGDVEGALAAYRRAFAATQSPISLHGVASLLHRLGRLDEARTAYGMILSAQLPDPADRWPALRGLAAVERDESRHAEADRATGELLAEFAAKPVAVASYLVLRDHSFPYREWVMLAEKSRLAEVLKRGREAEPGGARFPETFELPRERDALLAFGRNAPPGTFFIAKPSRGSGGQGITVTDDLAQAAAREDVVVQRYVERPYLVDGRKGHLRIYVLVTSAEPLRAYVYEDGIVRFAPEPYDLASDRRFDPAMHVTNTALHLGHPGLKVSDDPAREDEGSIWSVSALLRRIAEDGGNPGAVLDDIEALAAWFLRQLAREGLFGRQAASGPRRAYGPKLLGFDVLLDADAKPWLIEIQTSPAGTGAPLVNRINGQLCQDIFRMTVGRIGEAGSDLASREAEIEAANLGRFRRVRI